MRLNYRQLKLIAIGLASLIILLALSGCITNSQSERKQYLLNPSPKLIHNLSNIKQCNIVMNRVQATPPFDQLDFIYRTKTGEYLLDYYHGFFALPSVQLTTIFNHYFKNSSYFLSGGVPTIANLNQLQIELKELYADYSNPKQPQGVISLHLLLTQLIDNKNRIRLDQTLSAKIPLQKKNSGSLLLAWNQGLENIILQTITLLKTKLNCDK